MQKTYLRRGVRVAASHMNKIVCSRFVLPATSPTFLAGSLLAFALLPVRLPRNHGPRPRQCWGQWRRQTRAAATRVGGGDVVAWCATHMARSATLTIVTRACSSSRQHCHETQQPQGGAVPAFEGLLYGVLCSNCI